MDTARTPANRDSVAAGERVMVLDLDLVPKAVPDRLGITLRACRAFGKLGSHAGPMDHEIGLQDLICRPEVPISEEVVVETMSQLLVSLGHYQVLRTALARAPPLTVIYARAKAPTPSAGRTRALTPPFNPHGTRVRCRIASPFQIGNAEAKLAQSEQ